MKKTSKIYMDMLKVSNPELFEKLNEEEREELGHFIAGMVKLAICIRQNAIASFMKSFDEEDNNDD